MFHTPLRRTLHELSAKMARCINIAVDEEVTNFARIVQKVNDCKALSKFRYEFVKVRGSCVAHEMEERLRDCEIGVFVPKTMESVAKGLPPSMRWVHCAWAGVDTLDYLSKALKEKMQRCIITRSGGVFNISMAEYAICAIISMERNMSTLLKRRFNRDWSKSGGVEQYRNLTQLTVGILGLGDIGKEVAKLCSATGMTVYGMKTTAQPTEYVKKVYTSDHLADLLQHCDYICNVLPSTKKTRGLLSNDVLKNCAGRSVGFINIGRGDIISEESLVRAFQKGWLAKAYLDVFEKEPLSPDSPLWSLDDVVITPHVGGTGKQELMEDVFLENLLNYVNRKEMKYLYSWEKGY